MSFRHLLEQGSATPEEWVRAFAQEHPTPNVLHALGLCENGQISWYAAGELFAKALAAGLEAVK